MTSPALDGRAILIVEDEPLIALDIAQAFTLAGADVATTSTLSQARVLVEKDGLAAAVLDHVLGEGDSNDLCERLKARAIPFIIYSGIDSMEGECRNVPHVAKPVNPDVLVRMISQMLDGNSRSA